MFRFLAFCLLLSHILAAPNPFKQQRIVGGDLTTINQYPNQAALLYGFIIFQQICGSTILNSRSILTAAHCFWFSTNPVNYRIRVGSSYANSGGVIHDVPQIMIHPDFNTRNLDNDIAIVRSASVFIFTDVVQPAVIAGNGYNLADNEEVWAVGWGNTEYNGDQSEQLQHVQIWTINQAICRQRYMELGDEITNNMLCSGWLDVGGRDQCNGDSGGPLIHNGVVVGVCSWGEECALPRYPGVNARVSRFTNWIQTNA